MNIKWGQLNSLVAHRLSNPGDHGSNTDGEKKFKK